MFKTTTLLFFLFILFTYNDAKAIDIGEVLKYSIDNDNKEMLQLLIKKKRKSIDEEMLSLALSKAAARESSDILNYLTEQFPLKSINVLSDALTAAVTYGKIENISYLLNTGLHPDKQNRFGDSPLITAIEGEFKDKEKQQEIVLLLLNKKADPDINYNKYGLTALSIAVFNENKNIVELLLFNDADINKPNKDGTTPLMKAAVKNDIEMVRFLLNRGANPLIADNKKRTASMMVKKYTSVWKSLIMEELKRTPEEMISNTDG